ncbi:hypothetical protein B0H11DRAFT_1755828, partial [Mycena galericulata]
YLFSDCEINWLWGRQKSSSAYWFFVNRYFAFFSGIPVSALPFLTLSAQACRSYSIFREVAFVVSQIITSIIMMIRVYALFGRNKRVLWFVIATRVCVVGVSVWSVTSQMATHSITLGGCHFGLLQSTIYPGLAGSWEGLFVFDTVIFGLTVYNAYTTRRWMNSQMNLRARLVRDGVHFPDSTQRTS